MAQKFSIRASKHNSPKITVKKRIVAADEDMDLDPMDFDADVSVDDSFGDTLDNVADAVDDIQDTIDDTKEDPTNIEIENNIENHYIAECEKCHGIFISATVESDQEVERVSGECPLCKEESDQYLKWIVRKVERSPIKEDKGPYVGFNL